jgi:fumarylpyruvate hydrolase
MTEQNYVFTPAPIVGVPVVGSDQQFAVRRIYCVGRNYAEHIREMGGDERDPPFFFQKPTDSIVQSGSTVPYPSATEDFQYEIELVIAIGKAGRDLAASDATDYIFGLAVGIDLTRRDVQVAARKTGRPWEIGKSFDRSAPISAIHPLNGAPLPQSAAISLNVNDQPRQSGNIDQMIWGAEEIVSELSKLYELRPGDLIYTGTPAGIGPVVPGDRINGRVEGLDEITIHIGPK